MGYDASRLEQMSGDEAEVVDILNTIESLYQLEKSHPGQEKPGEAQTGELTEEELKKRGFVESQIQEIMLGVSRQLPVRAYARECYNWKQMYEIRMGLLENVDTALYENPMFSAAQMREIRLGLMDKLDVSSYAKLMYTVTDMSAARRRLLARLYQTNPDGFGKEIVDEETEIHIRISDNCLEAYMNVPEREKEYTPFELKKILMRHEVIYGISDKQLERIASEKIYGNEVLVARGKAAQKGKNGRYEYFFNRLLPESPKIHENGTVDYTEVIVAEKVKKGDILVRYYPGTVGRAGETVTGVVLDGQSGSELPRLVGVGFVWDGEKNTYTATTDGYVSLEITQYSMNVWNVLVIRGSVNRYNGNITYDGTVHIQGSVQDMAVITASGDVVVDGYIEGAEIKAGGNVILKRGTNADGKGFIQAGGRVMGNFFEYANIDARGKIEGNYFLNCNVHTDNSVIARGNKARIIGGNIKAAKAVESIVIGNFGRAKTVIDVGDISWIDKRKNQYGERLEKVKEELAQLHGGRDKLRNVLGADVLENNNLFRTTCLAIKMKEEQQATLERELQYFAEVKKNAKRAYVKAVGGIQEDVIVIINGTRKKIQKMTRIITQHK